MEQMEKTEQTAQTEPMEQTEKTEQTAQTEPMEQTEKKPLWTRILGGLVILALGTGLGVLLLAGSYRNYKYVMPNVTCQGQSLAGMTYDEAAEALEELAAAQKTYVDLDFGDGEVHRITPEQTSAERTPGTALSEVWAVGREDADALFGPFRSYLRARKASREIPMDCVFDYDPDSVLPQVQALEEELHREPTDSTGAVDETDHTVVVTLGEKGRTFDPEAMTEQVLSALEAGETSLSVEFDPIPLEEDQLKALMEDLSESAFVDVTETAITYDEAQHLSTMTVGTPGYSMDPEKALSLCEGASERGSETLSIPLQVTEPKPYDLAAFHGWVKSDPDETFRYVGGKLYGGTPGYDFDYDAALTALENADYGQVIEIPMNVVEPSMTAQEAEQLLFRDRLSSCDTYHTADYNRTTNLELACAAIDGTIINPGEEFSFNNVVGERTAAKGYRTGIVYVNKKSEPEIGGGICQVATGCYQAALKAGMEITERSEHMYLVTYCSPALDATVYWGSLDLRFVNPWSMPIRVNASVSGGQVHISIDGTNFTGHYITLSYAHVGGLSYRGYKTIHNPDGSELETIDLGVSNYSSH